MQLLKTALLLAYFHRLFFSCFQTYAEYLTDEFVIVLNVYRLLIFVVVFCNFDYFTEPKDLVSERRMFFLYFLNLVSVFFLIFFRLSFIMN